MNKFNLKNNAVVIQGHLNNASNSTYYEWESMFLDKIEANILKLSISIVEKKGATIIFEDSFLSNKMELINLTVYSCHVTYAFQSESTLYICLNVKELLARSRREI